MKVLLLMVFGTFYAFAQEKSLVLDCGGVGGYGGLYYEMSVLQKEKWSYTFRSGLSTYKLKDYKGNFNPTIIVPTSFQMIYGNKIGVVIGGGFTFSSTTFFDEQLKRSNVFSLHQITGIRWNGAHWTYQFSFTPMFERFRHFRPWFGLSFARKL